MIFRLFSCFFVFILFFDSVLCATNTDFKGFLVNDPYVSYNKKIFPNSDQTAQIVVSIKYSLIAVKKMDETLGQLELAGFVEASWTNNLLKLWTYDIDEMVLPQDTVWRPSLTIHNTVETAEEMGYRSNKIRIKKDGTHTWKVGLVSLTSCAIEMSHYPFDKHTCEIQIIPWGYTEDQVKLENSTSNVELTFYTENVQWELVETSVATSNIKGWSYFTASIKIARRPGNVLINYALPVLMLSLLGSLTYMMPADSGERIAYSIVSFLILVIHITMIADNIPRSSSPITILSLYLTLMVVMSALSIAMATLTLRIYAQEEVMAIPDWLKHVAFFLQCKKGKRCCPKKCCKTKNRIRHRRDSHDSDNDSESSSDDESMNDEENLDWDEMRWKDVGGVLDWTFFLLFFVTTLVVTIFFYFPLAFA